MSVVEVVEIEDRQIAEGHKRDVAGADRLAITTTEAPDRTEDLSQLVIEEAEEVNRRTIHHVTGTD